MLVGKIEQIRRGCGVRPDWLLVCAYRKRTNLRMRGALSPDSGSWLENRKNERRRRTTQGDGANLLIRHQGELITAGRASVSRRRYILKCGASGAEQSGIGHRNGAITGSGSENREGLQHLRIGELREQRVPWLRCEARDVGPRTGRCRDEDGRRTHLWTISPFLPLGLPDRHGRPKGRDAHISGAIPGNDR